MSAPVPEDLAAYVVAAARLHSLNLDPERLAAVARQFALLTEMAQCLEEVPLAPEREPAPVYRP